MITSLILTSYVFFNFLKAETHWHREAIAVISDWPRMFHDVSLSSGTADNHAVCIGLNTQNRFSPTDSSFYMNTTSVGESYF